ncbi:MAG: hypothetical protein Q4G16_01915 [Cruoricaptor ignavus]|nr:hypothetical protein [Cruoricaptor ignavus]
MELDNIKDLWKKENTSETPEISMEQQKEIHLPLDKIRKNMKMEFWMTIGSFPLIFVCFFPFINSPQKIVTTSMILVLMIILVGYYFSHFFKLYKKISTQSFKTYTNLLNLRYELVLNTEFYKSYYISFLPIFLCFYLGLFDVQIKGFSYFFVLILMMIFSSFILIFLGKIWLKDMYGKHIIQITDLIEELSDEEDDFKFDRNGLEFKRNYKIFKKTKSFFEQQFGKKGTLINTIFWWIVCIIALILFSFCIGYIIGFLGAKFNFIDEEIIDSMEKNVTFLRK